MAGEAVLWILGLAVVALVAIWLLSVLYRRTTKETAFVRTGFGGEKVVINRGAFVLPVIHEVMPVNLNLVRFRIASEGAEALITADRMRVDVDAEFFVRVAPTEDSVAMAATTLGRMTSDPESLADFFGGEFLGALRTAASEMTMAEMHENRAGFVERVRGRVGETVSCSGLTVDTVAIRNLDQTALEFFNPANQFDAEGLTRLVETVEDRRRLRNELEQKAIVSIREANLEAEKATLKLDRDSQLAKLEKEREVEGVRASQQSEIARERAAKEAESERARISAREETTEREISSRKATERREVDARQEVELARLESERALNEIRVGRDQQLREREVAKRRAVEIAELESQIAVLQKGAEEAEARISTGERRMQAAEAEERVSTARETAAAQREAEVSRIEIESEAARSRTRAEVAAEAERSMNEAANLLSDGARDARLKEALIQRLEGIIRETVEPVKGIKDIRVVHLGGIGSGDGGAKSPTDEVIESALRYRVQAPVIDELMKEVGIESQVSKMGDVFRSAKDAKSLSKDAEGSKGEGNG